MGQRLVQARTLMESVAKETHVPIGRLEEIQRLHRTILAALEMLISSMPEVPNSYALACMSRETEVRQQLLLMARALRFGRVTLLYRRNNVPVTAAEICPSVEEGDKSTQGMHWLAMRFAEQIERLRLRLSEIERQWNIEGAWPLGGA